MNSRGDIFRRPEYLLLREPGIHLRRRLGTWRILKDDANTIDNVFFEVVFYNQGGCNQPGGASGKPFTDGRVHVAEGAGGNPTTILKSRPA